MDEASKRPRQRKLLHCDIMIFKCFVLGLLCLNAASADVVLLIHEPDEASLTSVFEANVADDVTLVKHAINHDDDLDTTAFCGDLESQAIAGIVDLSWGGWEAAALKAREVGIPYVRVEASNGHFLRGVDTFLHAREAVDAALLFETEVDLDQSLYHIIGNFNLRVLVLSREETDPFARMKKLRPIPSAFVFFGTTKQATEILSEAHKKDLIRRDSRWHFIIEDFEAESFAQSGADVDLVVASMPASDCCGLLDDGEGQDEAACLASCTSNVRPKVLIAKKAAKLISEVFANLPTNSYNCDNIAGATNASRTAFEDALEAKVKTSTYQYDKTLEVFQYPTSLNFRLIDKVNKSSVDVATWTQENGAVFTPNFVDVPLPRYFRIGMAKSMPWLYEKLDSDGQVVKDDEGQIVYEGYCIDLLVEIAKRLKFEYEINISDETRPGYIYGKREEGDDAWSGMIGDLVRGETDIIVADLTMTSEREEVIDFVSPYFDQAGISIVVRKRLRTQTLFKFLSVLKTEVWLGIVAAVIITALLIWLLDRYSPYSARNNKAAYPYPCRDFTLKESFWFALTSLTPQGGGEAPKALSGRVLVAAYWLFVVLMLATFTANLAAFLTVERMQSVVGNLEELARQSRINYTVVSNTTYMEYFENMAGAEEELYQKWKELTLDSKGNPSKYRVWDYPIREQYTHILRVVQETGPVISVDDGFKNVLANTEGDYAFIHDAARIRYEVYNNCNLTEVGEPFAEQPYALAVQQGSHLQEELSQVILELQKDRYFESLQSMYWNSTARNKCPVMDDSEGITLQSLGGVFIATLIGLGLALITLAVEVFLQRRKAAQIRNSAASSTDGEFIKTKKRFNGDLPAVIN